jgi:hypothetical protein
MPSHVKNFFTTGLPRSPTPLTEVCREVLESIVPYPTGNVHPRFWAWYMGSSNLTRALGDFLAAIQGSNLGGGNHAAADMVQQVVTWCKEMVGFPQPASGTLVSSGSVANLIRLTVARNAKAGIDARERGKRTLRAEAAHCRISGQPRQNQPTDRGAHCGLSSDLALGRSVSSPSLVCPSFFPAAHCHAPACEVAHEEPDASCSGGPKRRAATGIAAR